MLCPWCRAEWVDRARKNVANVFLNQVKFLIFPIWTTQNEPHRMEEYKTAPRKDESCMGENVLESVLSQGID